jgi:hypothetical protein
MKKITRQLPILFALLVLSGLAYGQSSQTLPIKLQVDPSWHPDSTWVLAFPGSGNTAQTSIGLSAPVKLSTIPKSVITVDSGFSGRIYFFVQQGDASAILESTSGFPADSTFLVRYDFIEITYKQNHYDVANLSSVDQFGLTLSMATFKSNIKNDSVGYKVSANNLISQLQNIRSNPQGGAPVFNNDTNGRFIRVMSPLNAPGAYFNMANYVKLWVNSWISGAKDTIKIFGNYVGATAIFPNNVSVKYSAKHFFYNATISTDHNSVVLAPDPSVACKPAFLQGNITASITSLDSMIYPCDGNFYVSPAVSQLNGLPDRIGYNDPWGTVMRNFLVGFNTGYYENAANGLNQNYSWNWNPDSAFKFNYGGDPYYNQYASIIQSTSNSYGFPFTDFIAMPLLPIFGCDTLQVSLWSDNTTNFPDYTPIIINTSGVVPTMVNLLSYGQNIVFNFTNTAICPNSSVSLSFCDSIFQTGYSYTNMDSTKKNATSTSCNNITLTGFPLFRPSIMKDTLNKYPCSFGGQNFNLFIQTDINGYFINAYCDNQAITTTIAPNQLALTVNFGYTIDPANLQLSCPPSSNTNTTQPAPQTKKIKRKRNHTR